jgi:NAD(P)-dependent dehydrogenase (short-subunit alcohol dehydrogenase family)
MICKRYEGKVALVTGGASGIGRATVEGLAHEGAKVAFTDISGETGHEFERELRSVRGSDVMFVQSDATREADVAVLIEKIVARWGRLDVAINNVGNMGKADVLGVRVHDSTLEAFDSTLDVSLKTNFLGMKYEIAQMLKQGGGVIANTTSLAGVRITPYSTPGYVAAKAGVVHLTRYAAVLYARDNIRVNVIAPGLTETPAVLGAFPTAEARDAIASEFHPMGRMMKPAELADAFLWVCSDQASGITGLTIPVDGGWTAR